MAFIIVIEAVSMPGKTKIMLVAMPPVGASLLAMVVNDDAG
ncbi:hypothetical protein [Pseudomonas putida]|nr:hypothetical protein [Pseudomonas putida]